MFEINKYYLLYCSIIYNARTKKREKNKEIYFEEHHILPRCMFPEYENLKVYTWNSVLLTPREHFICHYLLCKMVIRNSPAWHKLVRAFTFMYSSSSCHSKRYVNSKLYEFARRNIGQIMSEAQTGELNSQFGTTWLISYSTSTTIKVSNDKVDEYLAKGFTKGRITNWETYREKLATKARLEKQNKIKALEKKLKITSVKIQELENYKEDILNQLSSL